MLIYDAFNLVGIDAIPSFHVTFKTNASCQNVSRAEDKNACNIYPVFYSS